MNSNPSSQAQPPKNSEEYEKYADGSYRYILKIVDQELGKESSISVPEIAHFTHKQWTGSRKWVVVDFLEKFRRDTDAE